MKNLYIKFIKKTINQVSFISLKNFLNSFKFNIKKYFTIIHFLFRNPRKFYNALSEKTKKWILRMLIVFLIIFIAIPVFIWLTPEKTEAAWPPARRVERLLAI